MKKTLKILLIMAIIILLEVPVLMNYNVYAEDENTESENVLESNTVAPENMLLGSGNTEAENNTSGEGNTTNNTTTDTPVVPEKKQISKVKIEVNTNTLSFTGKVRNCAIKNISDGNKKLVLNRDYTLTYRNNINPGRASVTIRGIGNYTGETTRFYYIAPARAKIKSVSFNYDYTKATITWKKDTRATGYILYMATSQNGKYKQIRIIKDKNRTSYTKSDLNPGKEYYFKMVSYKKVRRSKNT